MKKRILSIIMLLCIFSMLIPTVCGMEVGIEYGDLYYKIKEEGDAVIITDCKASARNVTIPSEIEGLPVTDISWLAFYECSKLKSVIIPDTVKSIAYEVFTGCENLVSVTIPASITHIGESAFDGCDSLTDVYYGGSKEDWNKIEIDDYNYAITDNVVIHYSSGEVSEVIADGDRDVKVIFDGKPMQFDVPPMVINDRVMVPLRAIFEALGAEVEWDGDTRTVTAHKDDTEISLTIDSEIMYVNDNAVELDAPACIVDDRTLVPVRAVSESLNCEVKWDGEHRRVIIIS